MATKRDAERFMSDWLGFDVKLKPVRRKTLSRRPASLTRRRGHNPPPHEAVTSSADTPPVAAAVGDWGAKIEGSDPPTTSRSGQFRTRAARALTVQEVRWSNDQAWLKSLMADADRPLTIRKAAEERLRALRRGRK